MNKPTKFQRFKILTIPRITWYISGRFIVEFMKDFWHNKNNKPPEYDDAIWCGKRYCRICGGKSK